MNNLPYIPTKTIKAIRYPDEFYLIPFHEVFAEVIEELFQPVRVLREIDDIDCAFDYHDKSGLPLISLCKHLETQFYNFNVSRIYDPEGKFLFFGPNLKDQILDFPYRNCEVILFDEDIGSGYLINHISNMLRDFYNVKCTIETTVKFDVDEDVLDIKDFIYKINSTSGLVVKDGDKISRIVYTATDEIMKDFGSIPYCYSNQIRIFFYIIAWFYHRDVSMSTHNMQVCESVLQESGYNPHQLHCDLTADDARNILRDLFKC